MTQKRTLLKYGILSLALAAPLSACAFDSLTVIGDSLSDTGNNGRWTWDSGQNKLYDEQLAERYGLALSPSSNGGSNYAAGGAMTAPELNPQDNTADQVRQWLANTGGKADHNGLYIHWVGGNDLAAAIARPAMAQQIAGNSATSAAAQVGLLLDAGAGLVVVPNVPDISATPELLEAVITVGLGAAAPPALKAALEALAEGATPDFASRQQAIRKALLAAAATVSSNPFIQQLLVEQLLAGYEKVAEQASALTDYYNQMEEKGLEQHGGNIARADINGLFKEILANPQAFGLTNTVGMACPPGVSASVCSSAMPGFNASQDYLFADHLHPGPQVHTIIAQYIQSIIAAPVQATYLNQSVQSMAQGSRTTLDSRYQQLRQGENPVGSLGMFGGYSGGYQRYDNNEADGNGNHNNLTVGVDYQLNEQVLLGGLIAGSLDKQHPDDNYRYDARGFQAAVFSHLRAGQAWLDGDLHYLSAKFSNIQRSITLGALRRVEEGETNGRLWGARLTSGYDFVMMPWLTTGPMLQYAWDYSHVNGYSEKLNTSTSMRFGDQNAHSQMGSVGWRLDLRHSIIHSWAQINYRRQFGDDTYVANGGLKSTALTFSRAGKAQDKNWVDIAIGADFPLSATVSAFAGLAQTAGLSDGNQTRYNVGFSARF
ncbi:autotransporter domain-containing esterase [Salmonella enterica]|uniref:Autotransporter domain-containing esterase n=2 Tax=Salmonella typhi TaxID=90370 RepID=A0A5X5T3U4_SALTI|nr:autotransporter domain-containing esterase [Salmonella enterica]EHQ7460133.1 autotransporter domain-containing esterase [Salmonella enterica subsp. enterica]MDK9590440.1 autotransporter domain-containing esterase [Salmonella enterica subsp. enterica serovar Typhimurium]HAD4863103.1 autotransporter domain-containing esterase [Salmonella enterica subsp. enterica serovar Typhi str. CT18]EAP1757941.1 autotransporter domain-containing esterase [Salmonella enterica]EAQ1470714.1 autotransporter do